MSLLGIALSGCGFFIAYLVDKQRFSVLPFFLLNLLFLLVFHLPGLVLNLHFEWYFISSKTQSLILLSHLFAFSSYFVFDRPVAKMQISNLSTEMYSFKNIHLVHAKRHILFIAFFLGCIGYIVLFLIKGIPALSANQEYARQLFSSGMGAFLWPLKASLIMPALIFLVVGETKKSWVMLLAATCIFLLTGWRGTVVVMFLAAITIYIYKTGKAWVMFFCLLVGVIFLGYTNLVRSGGIYSLNLSENLFDNIINSFIVVISRLGVDVRALDFVVQYWKTDFNFGLAGLNDLISSFIPGIGKSIVYLFKALWANWQGGGGMPATWLGGFYIDFGWLGTPVAAFFASGIYFVTFSWFESKVRQGSIINFATLGLVNSAFLFGFLGTFTGYFFVYISVYLIFGLILWQGSYILKETLRK